MPSTWSWMVSTCFGKGAAETNEADRRRHAKMVAAKYGATGVAAPAVAAPKLDPVAGKEAWSRAIKALVEDIESGADAKCPSFQWKMRLGYGKGATCLGSGGCKSISDILIKKIRERKANIKRITQQLAQPANREESAFVGLTSSSAVVTPIAGANPNDQALRPVSPAPQQPALSQTERSLLMAQLAELEATPAHCVRQLDLRDQDIGDLGIDFIGYLLAEDTLIEVLILSKNNITGRGIVDLAKGLQQNRASLKRLVIADNIDSRGVVALCRAIKTQQLQEPVPTPTGGGSSSLLSPVVHPSSVALDGSMNNNTINMTSNVLVPISSAATPSEFVGTTNGLVELELGFGNCTLNDDAGMALRDACFSGGSLLRSIKISASPKAFTVASLGAVLRGLTQNRRLVSLSFNNCIDELTLAGPNGARPFLEPFAAGALCRSDSPLRLLEIIDIPIGDTGARVITDALRMRTAAHVRTLSLVRCSIGALGFESIGAMLEANPYVTRLDLNGNLMSKNRKADLTGPPVDVILPMVTSLTKNATLQELFISDYTLTKPAVTLLVDHLIKGNTTQGKRIPCKLRTVRFGQCDAPDNLTTRLHNLLTENTEAHLADQKDTQEKQQQQQQQQLQQAAVNSSARRAVVSFTSGGAVPIDHQDYGSPSSNNFRRRSNSVTSGSRGGISGIAPQSPTTGRFSNTLNSSTKSPSLKPVDNNSANGNDGAALDKIQLDF